MTDMNSGLSAFSFESHKTRSSANEDELNLF